MVVFFFFFYLSDLKLSGALVLRDQLGSSWDQLQCCLGLQNACLRWSNFFRNSAVLARRFRHFLFKRFIRVQSTQSQKQSCSVLWIMKNGQKNFWNFRGLGVKIFENFLKITILLINRLGFKGKVVQDDELRKMAKNFFENFEA